CFHIRCTACLEYLYWMTGVLDSLYDNTHHALFVGVYILIAVGAVMMFVGFLGCYGAIQESQCLLGTVNIFLINVISGFQLNCCGKGGLLSGATMLFSETCPKDKKTASNCHDKIRELFSEKIYLIGIAALVVAVIMIFEMIFSMVLCCGIRNSPVY
uniref:CD81 molecule a n=1 Tax=Cyprinus carpio TaxID=7962 RepID=A0A8C1MHU9_CYPCA